MSHVPNPWTVDTLGTEGTASHFLLEHGTFKDSVSQDVYKAPPSNNYKLTIKTVFIICIIFKKIIFNQATFLGISSYFTSPYYVGSN